MDKKRLTRIRFNLLVLWGVCVCAALAIAAYGNLAHAQVMFKVEPICDGPVLKGLRGRVPEAGAFTIYIPADICAGARPLSRLS